MLHRRQEIEWWRYFRSRMPLFRHNQQQKIGLTLKRLKIYDKCLWNTKRGSLYQLVTSLPSQTFLSSRSRHSAIMDRKCLKRSELNGWCKIRKMYWTMLGNHGNTIKRWRWFWSNTSLAAETIIRQWRNAYSFRTEDDRYETYWTSERNCGREIDWWRHSRFATLSFPQITWCIKKRG